MTPDIITIVGYANSGKTTFLEKLIAELTRRGHRIGTVKHTHHTDADLDPPGTDTWRHRKAGASATLFVTPDAVSLVRDDDRPDRERISAYLTDADLILAEGFKGLPLPKIEIFRTAGPSHAPLFAESPDLIALVTDTTFRPDVPVFSPEDAAGVASLLESRYLNKKETP